MGPYDNEWANERYRARMMREWMPVVYFVLMIFFLICFGALALCITNENLILTSLEMLR